MSDLMEAVAYRCRKLDGWPDLVAPPGYPDSNGEAFVVLLKDRTRTGAPWSRPVFFDTVIKNTGQLHVPRTGITPDPRMHTAR